MNLSIFFWGGVVVVKGWFLKICQDYNFIFVKINIYFFLFFEDKRQSNVKTGDVKGEESYKSLKDMVESTAAMAEEAVNCSPNRARTILRSMESDYNVEQFRRCAFKTGWNCLQELKGENYTGRKLPSIQYILVMYQFWQTSGHILLVLFFFLLVVLIPVQWKLRAKVPLGKQRVRPETQMMIFFQTRRYISLLEFISN